MKQLANSLPHQRAAVRPCSYAKNLVDLTDKLFTLQTKLEHYKMVGYGDMGEVKQHLGSMANGLVELQECLRALSAMG